MATHSATIEWERHGESFVDNRYSRRHTWRFDGGAVVLGSSAPSVVPPPMSDPAGVDPEEAFVASLSSCHMLWFLSLAAEEGFVVENYRDEAEAVMERNTEGKLAITVVTLRPKATFVGGKLPSVNDIHDLHQKSHEECFIANSIKAEVHCVPAV